MTTLKYLDSQWFNDSMILPSHHATTTGSFSFSCFVLFFVYVRFTCEVSWGGKLLKEKKRKRRKKILKRKYTNEINIGKTKREEKMQNEWELNLLINRLIYQRKRKRYFCGVHGFKTKEFFYLLTHKFIRFLFLEVEEVWEIFVNTHSQFHWIHELILNTF